MIFCLASDSDAKLDLELEEFEELELMEMLEAENTKINASLESCINLILFTNILLAILIGCVCTSIFSKFFVIRS